MSTPAPPPQPIDDITPAEMQRWQAATALLRWLLLGLSGLFALLFVYAAARRLHYPFELERMESGMLTSVWWIRGGHPLYGAPTLTFVPFLYGPVFLYLSALVSHVTGIGYTATRLVSIASTLGSCAVIFAFVYRESRREAGRASGRVLPALAAAGLFLSLYSMLEAWYDLGRVDSLSVFLFLLALYVTRFGHPVLAACVWVLAFQTKQGFLPLPPLLMLFEWQRPRRLVLGVASYLVLACASVLWMDYVFHGWYRWYVFGTAAQLGWVWRQFVLYVPNDLLGGAGIALSLAVLACIAVPVRALTRRASFYLFTSVLLFALIGFVRGHNGAVLNAVIPAYAWTAVLFGLALGRLLGWAATLRPALRLRAECAVLLLAAVQLALHLYNPGRWIPSRDALAARTAFLNELRGIPGEVWVVNHSWDNVLAGKPTHPELDSFDAVAARPVTERNRAVLEALRRAYAERQFSAVILDHPRQTYEPRVGFSSPDFLSGYPLEVTAAGAGQAFEDSQPSVIYAPCALAGETGDPLHAAGSFTRLGACPLVEKAVRQAR